MGDRNEQPETGLEKVADPSVERAASQANDAEGKSEGDRQAAAVQTKQARTVVVELLWLEVIYAGLVALDRVLYNLEYRISEKHGAETELGGLNYHFAGCLGELAVAKHFGQFWSGSLGNFKAKDVGVLQVRAGTRVDHRLILHPEDSGDDIFVLAHAVTDRLPRIRLAGWLRGVDGKQQQFWGGPGTGRPAYWIGDGRVAADVDVVG